MKIDLISQERKCIVSALQHGGNDENALFKMAANNSRWRQTIQDGSEQFKMAAMTSHENTLYGRLCDEQREALETGRISLGLFQKSYLKRTLFASAFCSYFGIQREYIITVEFLNFTSAKRRRNMCLFRVGFSFLRLDCPPYWIWLAQVEVDWQVNYSLPNRETAFYSAPSCLTKIDSTSWVTQELICTSHSTLTWLTWEH